MSNSKLTTYTKLSNHYSSRWGNKISKIFIHHMAGNLTVQQCGQVFQRYEVSTHYGVNGKNIGRYLDESKRAWATASPYWDRRSISIELANDGGAKTNWHVSDTTINTAIKLIADICKRNGIKKLTYTGDMKGNLCMHKWVASTACPGPYLASKFKYIASEVNKLLDNTSINKTESTKKTYSGTLPTKTVKFGDSGDQVKAWQRFLKWYGYVIVVDGVFGQGTKDKTKSFQIENGLIIDGIVGPKTISKAKKCYR